MLKIIIGSLFILGCWPNQFIQEPIGESGNMFRVGAAEYDLCGGNWHTVEDCINNLRPEIDRRAKEACGKKPLRTFGCGHTSRDGSRKGRFVTCTIQCDQHVKRQIIEENKKPTKIDRDIVKKAKKCQKNGGVWINDICQLILD
mgnify:CR=1 FL=1